MKVDRRDRFNDVEIAEIGKRKSLTPSSKEMPTLVESRVCFERIADINLIKQSFRAQLFVEFRIKVGSKFSNSAITHSPEKLGKKYTLDDIKGRFVKFIVYVNALEEPREVRENTIKETEDYFIIRRGIIGDFAEHMELKVCIILCRNLV